MKNHKKISKNFIYQIIENDLASGKYSVIYTRFPPEPNGYLHIGHAKSICLNFGIAKYYHGYCNLRFDDTNPVQEHIKYIEAIKQDIKWLGFKWHGVIHYSSDYLDKLYLYAIELIKKGLAYVDELSREQLRNYRGTLTDPGKDSPYRFRTIEENLSLFDKMKRGEFLEGAACLRAKIDMTSPYIIMRDPVLYRIKFLQHHNTGTKWCIYPTYDFTHCISDAIEGITHSLCTLEFQDNRRLYDWILQNISIDVYPRQYEFSRLNLEYTVMSKRYLQLLVNKNLVDGWDDPRMPTIAGFRRKGYTASSIREFCHRIGLTRQSNTIEMSALESCIRKELNNVAPRVMAVMNPIKIILHNLPKNYEERILVPNHPYKPDMGMRTVIFTREIMIEKSDFQEQSNFQNRYKRFILGEEVRLRHAYIIKADYVKKNEEDDVVIYCTCDLETLNKHPKDGRRVQGVIHWVSCIHAVSSEFRLYNSLFTISNPLDSNEDFLNLINPNSLIIYHGFVESKKIISKINVSYQFERIGYFCIDSRNSQLSNPIFNRIVSLRESTT